MSSNQSGEGESAQIPDGWKVGSFSEFVEVLREQVNPLEQPETMFRHFSIPAFDEGQRPKDELGGFIKSQKSRVMPGVVLLSKLNPEIDRVWLVDVDVGDKAVCSTEFLVLSLRKPVGRAMIYCLARSQAFRQSLASLVTGTSKSHQRAQVASILALTSVLPSGSTVSAFERMADPLLARSLQCRREAQALVALRDSLLPKLVAGEIRVTPTANWAEASKKLEPREAVRGAVTLSG